MDMINTSVLAFRDIWWKKAKCEIGFELSPEKEKGESSLTQDFRKEGTWADHTQT